MQVKLLRAIQESEFERVGGIKTIGVDVRLIAATNRDLSADVSSGHFREDLYYRLNVVPVRLPALRERREDLPLLVDQIMAKFARRLNQPVRKLGPEALGTLTDYSWPGNIRELENVLERTLLLSDAEVLDLTDLPTELQAADGAVALDGPVDVPVGMSNLKDTVKLITRKIERKMIVQVLDETDGNVTQASRRLGISRKSLQTKMKDFGLRDDLSPG